MSDQLMDELKRIYYAGQKPEYQQLKVIAPNLSEKEYRSLVEHFITSIRESEFMLFKEHEAQVQKILPEYADQTSWMLFFEQDIVSRLHRFLMQRDHELIASLSNHITKVESGKKELDTAHEAVVVENKQLKEQIAALTKTLQALEQSHQQQEQHLRQVEFELKSLQETEVSHKRIIELLSHNKEGLHQQEDTPSMLAQEQKPALLPDFPAPPFGHFESLADHDVEAAMEEGDDGEGVDPVAMQNFMQMAKAMNVGLGSLPASVVAKGPFTDMGCNDDPEDEEKDASPEDTKEDVVTGDTAASVAEVATESVESQAENIVKVHDKSNAIEQSLDTLNEMQACLFDDKETKDLTSMEIEEFIDLALSEKIFSTEEPDVCRRLVVKSLLEGRDAVYAEDAKCDDNAIIESLSSEEHKLLARAVLLRGSKQDKIENVSQEQNGQISDAQAQATEASSQETHALADIPSTESGHSGSTANSIRPVEIVPVATAESSSEKEEPVAVVDSSSAQSVVTSYPEATRKVEADLQNVLARVGTPSIEEKSDAEPQDRKNDKAPIAAEPVLVRPTSPVDSQLQELKPAQATASSYGLPTSTPSLNISLPSADSSFVAPISGESAVPAVLLNRSSPKALARDESTLLQESKGKHGDENIAAIAAATARIESLAPLLSESGKELRQAKEEIDAILEGKPVSSVENKESLQTTSELASVAQDIVKTANELDHKPVEKKTSVFDNCFTTAEDPSLATGIFGEDGGDFVAGNSHIIDAEESFVTGNTTREEHFSSKGDFASAVAEAKHGLNEDELSDVIASSSSTLPLGSKAELAPQESSSVSRGLPLASEGSPLASTPSTEALQPVQTASSAESSVKSVDPLSYNTFSTGSTNILSERAKPVNTLRPQQAPVSTIIATGSGQPITPSGKPIIPGEQAKVVSSKAEESTHGSAIIGVDHSVSFKHSERDSLNDDEKSRFNFLYRNLEHQIARTKGEIGVHPTEQQLHDFCNKQLQILDRNQYLTTRLRAALKEQLDEDLDPRRAALGYTVVGAEVRSLRQLLPVAPESKPIQHGDSVVGHQEDKEGALDFEDSGTATTFVDSLSEEETGVMDSIQSDDDLRRECDTFNAELEAIQELNLKSPTPLEEKSTLFGQQIAKSSVIDDLQEKEANLLQSAQPLTQQKDEEIHGSHKVVISSVDGVTKKEDAPHTEEEFLDFDMTKDEDLDDITSEEFKAKHKVTFAEVDFAALDEEEGEIEEDDSHPHSAPSSFCFIDGSSDELNKIKGSFEAIDQETSKTVDETLKQEESSVVTTEETKLPHKETPLVTKTWFAPGSYMAKKTQEEAKTVVVSDRQPVVTESMQKKEEGVTEPSAPILSEEASGISLSEQQEMQQQEFVSAQEEQVVKAEAKEEQPVETIKEQSAKVEKQEQVQQSPVPPAVPVMAKPELIQPKIPAAGSGVATGLRREMPQWVAPRAPVGAGLNHSKDIQRQYGKSILNTDSTNFSFGSGRSSYSGQKPSGLMFIQSSPNTSIIRTDRRSPNAPQK